MVTSSVRGYLRQVDGLYDLYGKDVGTYYVGYRLANLLQRRRGLAVSYELVVSAFVVLRSPSSIVERFCFLEVRSFRIEWFRVVGRAWIRRNVCLMYRRGDLLFVRHRLANDDYGGRVAVQCEYPKEDTTNDTLALFTAVSEDSVDDLVYQGGPCLCEVQGRLIAVDDSDNS